MRWDDVNARARGLGLHLLRPTDFAVLGTAQDLSSLAQALEHRGIRVSTTPGLSTSATLEAAVRRAEGNRLALLARWCGTRVAALAAVYDAEDRRSLRALARGAVEGAPPESRMAGLLPTPTLPARALEVLARLPTPGAIGATLAAWGHGLAAPFRAVGGQERPDLLRLDLELGRGFAGRATTAVKKAEPRLLPDLQLLIDLENLRATLLLEDPRDLTPADCWVPGGRALQRDVFLASLARTNLVERVEYLIRMLAPSPLASMLRRHGADLTALEQAIFAWRRNEAHRLARLDPLGPMPTLEYALAVQAEVFHLRRLIWGRAMGASAQDKSAGEAA